MNPVLLLILSPLAAVAVIVLVRRAPALWSLLGAAMGVGASIGVLVAQQAGRGEAVWLPGVPGLRLELLATPVTALLTVVVAVVGALVLVYAVGYMKGDPQRVRFFATMSFFIAAMQILVLAADWILLLAAWELIGLCSYLLIGFWYQRPGVADAASRAFLYTRTADLGLYGAVFLLIGHTGTNLMAASLALRGGVATTAALLLLLAAMGKSAQVPLQRWLQDAMAGPTPVSALLHSATLVAAGAILLIRVSPMLTPAARVAVGTVGGVTTVVAGLIAVTENDLKRLLAASTSSQYGLMLIAIGAAAPVAALLHLVAHAAIKSALFLGAGVFQRARAATALGELGGAGRDQPRMFLGFAVAGLALAGVPPLSGFFTKDAIIAAALHAPQAALLAPLALAGTLLTGLYVARALRILWHGHGAGSAVAGVAWMAAGSSALVALAALLGIAVDPVASWVHAPVPRAALAVWLGVPAVVGGLVTGWLLPGGRPLGWLSGAARRGFAPSGGFEFWISRPVLGIARACDRLEQALLAGVCALRRAGVLLGRVARHGDERIDRLIAALVDHTRALSARARRLQSGLVHRELALATLGTVLIIAGLLASSWS